MKNETSLVEIIRNNSIVVFDIETTGLDEKTSEIVKIEAVKISKGKTIGKYETYVKNQLPIIREVFLLSKIREENIAKAPSIEVALVGFLEFTKDCILCAHYLDFDMRFLNYNANKLGFCFQNETIDMYECALDIVKNKCVKYSLSKLLDLFVLDGKTECEKTISLLYFFANEEMLEFVNSGG